MVSKKHNYMLWVIVAFITILAAIAYGIGYNRYIAKYKNEFNDKTIKYNEIIRAEGNNINKGTDNKQSFNKDFNNESMKNESSEVIAQNGQKINNKTELTTIVIDKSNKTTDKDTQEMPSNFIGFTKMQLAKYYEYYIMNKPIEEMEKGLLSVRIIDFSKDEVVIQKIYDESTVLYYITESDGYVKVFYSDKETLYENTGILTKELPAIEQRNIKLGMFVKNKDELISILEGYSS